MEGELDEGREGRRAVLEADKRHWQSACVSDLPALHAQDEGDGIHKVGLAAAIRPDDGRKVTEGAYHLR